MSLGMFRGKESSNRIELSRLVQDLLNFGDLGSLWLWGVGVGVCGWAVVGECPPHMCTCIHMHAHTHMHAHACTCMRGKLIISCKWPPPLGEYLGIPYDVICMCMCTYVGVPSHHPTPIQPPPPPRGDPRNQSKFNST